MAVWPDVETVRAWAGVPVADISDDQLQLILDAEADIQAAYCTWDPYLYGEDEIPEAIAQALLRRCARAIAARGLPLGSLPSTTSGVGADFGLPARALLLPRLDNEVERYEAPYRVTAIA